MAILKTRVKQKIATLTTWKTGWETFKPLDGEIIKFKITNLEEVAETPLANQVLESELPLILTKTGMNNICLKDLPWDRAVPTHNELSDHQHSELIKDSDILSMDGNGNASINGKKILAGLNLDTGDNTGSIKSSLTNSGCKGYYWIPGTVVESYIPLPEGEYDDGTYGYSGYIPSDFTDGSNTVLLVSSQIPTSSDWYGRETSYLNSILVTDHGWTIGDIVSLVNDQKYDMSYKITNIDGAKLTLSPINGNSDLTNRADLVSFNSDDWSIYNNTQPTEGIISLGNYTFSFGENAKAYERDAVAFGRDVHAVGQYSFVAGRSNYSGYACGVFGRNNSALKEFSFISGSDNIIQAKQAIAQGKSNYILGEGFRSAALGAFNSIGLNSTALRTEKGQLADNEYSSNNPGQYSIALGYGNTISGFCGFAAGDQNTITAKNGISIGYRNSVSGASSGVIGNSNTVSGSLSFAIGNGHNIKGSNAVAIGGVSHTVDGNYSIALGTSGANISTGQVRGVCIGGSASCSIIGTGIGNMLFGSNSKIETRAKNTSSGNDTITGHNGGGSYNFLVGGDQCEILENAHQCVVGGKSNTAKGYRSTIFGYLNKDNGKQYTTILGYGNNATNNYQTLLGKFSKPDVNTIFAVGNGTSSSNNKNAIEVRARKGYGGTDFTQVLLGANPSTSNEKLEEFYFTENTQNVIFAVDNSLIVSDSGAVHIPYAGCDNLYAKQYISTPEIMISGELIISNAYTSEKVTLTVEKLKKLLDFIDTIELGSNE